MSEYKNMKSDTLQYLQRDKYVISTTGIVSLCELMHGFIFKLITRFYILSDENVLKCIAHGTFLISNYT